VALFLLRGVALGAFDTTGLFLLLIVISMNQKRPAKGLYGWLDSVVWYSYAPALRGRISSSSVRRGAQAYAVTQVVERAASVGTSQTIIDFVSVANP
jgi:hypothetical protein